MKHTFKTSFQYPIIKLTPWIELISYSNMNLQYICLFWLLYTQSDINWITNINSLLFNTIWNKVYRVWMTIINQFDYIFMIYLSDMK